MTANSQNMRIRYLVTRSNTAQFKQTLVYCTTRARILVGRTAIMDRQFTTIIMNNQ